MTASCMALAPSEHSVPPCPLLQVPEQLSRLTRLTSLDLNHNKIQDVPLHLARMTQLKRLQLRHNPLRQPYAALHEARGALPLLPLADPTTSALDLSEAGLPELPQELLRQVEVLQQLKLSGNRFSALPEVGNAARPGARTPSLRGPCAAGSAQSPAWAPLQPALPNGCPHCAAPRRAAPVHSGWPHSSAWLRLRWTTTFWRGCPRCCSTAPRCRCSSPAATSSRR